jgi:hypothetical protein
LSEPVAVVQLTLGEGEPVVLDVGTAADEGNEVYVRRRGNETIYLVSEYLANRIQPDAKAFEKSDEPPPAAAPMAPPAGGQPQLPPDVMRQIREQIEAQQRQQN